jgi:hypothetical protein
MANWRFCLPACLSRTICVCTGEKWFRTFVRGRSSYVEMASDCNSLHGPSSVMTGAAEELCDSCGIPMEFPSEVPWSSEVKGFQLFFSYCVQN